MRTPVPLMREPAPASADGSLRDARVGTPVEQQRPLLDIAEVDRADATEEQHVITCQVLRVEPAFETCHSAPCECVARAVDPAAEQAGRFRAARPVPSGEDRRELLLAGAEHVKLPRSSIRDRIRPSARSRW